MSRAVRALVDSVPSETIAIDDRAVQYGHGMFEICRVVDGTIPLWHYHRMRLEAALLCPNVAGVWALARVVDPADARGRPGRIAGKIQATREARVGFGRSL